MDTGSTSAVPAGVAGGVAGALHESSRRWSKPLTIGLAAGLVALIAGVLGTVVSMIVGPLDLGEAVAQLVRTVVFAAIFFIAIYLLASRKSGSAPYQRTFAFNATFVVVLAMSVGWAIGWGTSDGANRQAAKDQAVARQAAADQARERAAAERARVAALTPEQRQEEGNAPVVKRAAELLKARQDFFAHVKGASDVAPDVWADYERKVLAIPLEERHGAEAKSLATAMAAVDKLAAAKEKRDAAEAARVTERNQAESRRLAAKVMEQEFLERRMDTTCTTSGPGNTTMTIKWILASRVTANDLRKSGLLERLRDMGFKKVIYTDGYDFSWGWDL